VTLAPIQGTAGFISGTSVTLTAIPDNDYKFSSWNGISGSTSTVTFQINNNLTVSANFVRCQNDHDRWDNDHDRWGNDHDGCDNDHGGDTNDHNCNDDRDWDDDHGNCGNGDHDSWDDDNCDWFDHR
jgi:hypothetical protein